MVGIPARRRPVDLMPRNGFFVERLSEAVHQWARRPIVQAHGVSRLLLQREPTAPQDASSFCNAGITLLTAATHGATVRRGVGEVRDQADELQWRRARVLELVLCTARDKHGCARTQGMLLVAFHYRATALQHENFVFMGVGV